MVSSNQTCAVVSGMRRYRISGDITIRIDATWLAHVLLSDTLPRVLFAETTMISACMVEPERPNGMKNARGWLQHGS